MLYICFTPHFRVFLDYDVLSVCDLFAPSDCVTCQFNTTYSPEFVYDENVVAPRKKCYITALGLHRSLLLQKRAKFGTQEFSQR
jgi:hypothetical protein